MKVFLAGENGKQKILQLYEDIHSKWYNEGVPSSLQTDRQTDRQTKCTHLCKSMRGVRSSGEMTVSVLTGLFKDEPEARREFYKLIDAQ